MVYRQGNFRKAYFDTQYKKFDMGKGKNPSSNLIFLNDAEFDNRLSGFFLTGKYLNEQYYGDLITHIEEILEIMNKEIGTD